MSVPNRGVLNDSSASLLIKTPNRELKLTAPDMERHALWYKVCQYSGGIIFFVHKGDQVYIDPKPFYLFLPIFVSYAIVIVVSLGSAGHRATTLHCFIHRICTTNTIN